jgi:NNP family nitrate/nitrite transporter-like MFS transporter
MDGSWGRGGASSGGRRAGAPCRPDCAFLATGRAAMSQSAPEAESKWIVDWNPEDPSFWEARGKRIARRNLIWSIFAEHLGFSIWLIWSVVATKLASVGFHFTTDQLFNLVALPGLVGCLARFPYAFAVPKFGGRNWTIVSVALLLVPTVGLAFLVSRPESPYWLVALTAASAGLGGGNFASSMANISFFFPDRDKGYALGLNAAGGNIGVCTVQLLIPMLLGLSWISFGLLPERGGIVLANAGLVWLPLLGIAAYGAARWMNNLASARASFRDQFAITSRKHTWIMSWLYIGTFGSFIGYSAAFPLLLRTQFPETATNLAFLGPLVGSLARPLGGKLADRFGGTRMTLWTFVAMAVTALSAVHFVDAHSFAGFVGAFLALFATAGIGNGTTFRMIPIIFRNEKLREVAGKGLEAREAAIQAARVESATVLGFVSAVGAVGGYFVPRALGASLKATGSAHGAFSGFVVFYATCVAVTWVFYARRKPHQAVFSSVEASLEAQV